MSSGGAPQNRMKVTILKKTLVGVGLLMLAVLLAVFYGGSSVPPSADIVVAVVGDLGANNNTSKVLRAIEVGAPDFTVFLGDFSYDEVVPESAWCAFVKKRVLSSPVLLLSGNHESDGMDGDINEFSKCLPAPIGSVGEYAKEYFVDYPADTPLARFIFISPDLRFSSGETYEYAQGTRHRAWLENALSTARAKNIPWVIVGMHKNCITPDAKTCEVSEELMNYVMQEKVDLILQGHSHLYGRTHQLTCLKDGEARRECIKKSDTDTYTKGEGSIIAIVGTGGAPIREVVASKNTGYFATSIGAQETPFYGYGELAITGETLKFSFVPIRSGLFGLRKTKTDTVTITKSK